MTGRKTVALPPGHLNPAVDADQRASDVETMLTTSDEATFLSLARKYDVDFLIRPRDESEDESRLTVYTAWSRLSPAFVSESGDTIIYRISPP